MSLVGDSTTCYSLFSTIIHLLFHIYPWPVKSMHNTISIHVLKSNWIKSFKCIVILWNRLTGWPQCTCYITNWETDLCDPNYCIMQGLVMIRSKQHQVKLCNRHVGTVPCSGGVHPGRTRSDRIHQSLLFLGSSAVWPPPNRRSLTSWAPSLCSLNGSALASTQK